MILNIEKLADRENHAHTAGCMFQHVTNDAQCQMNRHQSGYLDQAANHQSLD